MIFPDTFSSMRYYYFIVNKKNSFNQNLDLNKIKGIWSDKTISTNLFQIDLRFYFEILAQKTKRINIDRKAKYMLT